ncbi:uncharacterized mitochondrial protein-like protein [Tanacetum coccineum]
MRPFGCPVTILSTIDHLDKFDGKADEGFFVGYSLNSKAFRNPKSSHDDGSKPSSDDRKKVDEDPRKESKCKDQETEDNVNNTNNVNTVSSTVNVADTNKVNAVGGKTSIELPFDSNMHALEDYSIFNFSRDDKDDGVVADMNNLDTTIQLHNKKDVKEFGEHGFLRFKDPDFPDRVYKVEKALYGLHQAPRAWYETLSTYLLDNRFQRGKIDKTLFIKRHKGDILLVQVYVDDIIFGSTKKELYNAFEKLMHEKFQMSSMGELTFFLGLQVQQKKDGIFISQDKYVVEILKKFGFTEVKTASTPMETQKPLLKDEDGKEVDVHMYRSMIGSLMYLTSSRPDIMFAVCACARYQVNPKVSHLHAVKRIFRYLKGQLKLGLWYPKDSPFDLVAYTDSDYAGASLDRKSTTGGCQFLGCRLISWQCKKQTVVANSITEAEFSYIFLALNNSGHFKKSKLQRKESRNRADTRECKEAKGLLSLQLLLAEDFIKKEIKSYYQIMRADGNSQTYMIFSQMLKSFDRQDLEDLYKLVKAKYESTRPVEDLDLLLWGDLKTMF